MAKSRNGNGSGRGNGQSGGKHISEIRSAAVRKKLPGLCEEYRTIQEQISELESAKRALKGEIDAIARKARISKVVGDGWQLVKVKGRKTLSKERLVEQGVDTAVIDASMVEGRPYFMVRKGEEG